MTVAPTSSALVTTKSGATVDLNKRETFKGHVLTPEQMRARLQILTVLAEQIDKQEPGKQLTPKSIKEFEQLDQLNDRAGNEVLDGQPPFKICLVPNIPYYRVQFGRTKVESYKDVQQQIAEVPRTPVQVLRAIQPMSRASSFQGLILDQMQSVLSSDFMNALKATLMGNMCVLRASVLLMGKPELFRDVLSLYTSSSDLYNTQITYNRQFELELLQNTEDTYHDLQALHRQILTICGTTLDEKPELVQAVQAYREAEAKATIKVNTAITTHCDTFLNEIDALKKRTLECINKITDKNKEVEAALTHMTKLVQQQDLLTTKQNKMQAEFDAYQSAKQKELDSRRVTEKGSSFKLFFITLYSTLNTQVTKEDFGSEEAYKRYLLIKQEETVLSNAITNAKNTLANTMAGVIAYGQDQNSLQSSMHALSTSVLCVHQLEVALNQRRRHAQDQIDTCKKILQGNDQTTESKSGMSVENALAFIQEVMRKTIKKQALWLASHRQTFTLQNFQQLEQEVRLMVIGALTGDEVTPAALVTTVTALLSDRFPTDPSNPQQVHQIVEAQLVPYDRMLQLTEGTRDYDEKGAS